jgi:biotin carboxyl carrier protein
MNNYEVTINGNTYSVTIDGQGLAVVEGIGSPVDVEQVDDHIFSVLHNGRSIKVIAEGSGAGYSVLLNSSLHNVRVETERDKLIAKYSSPSEGRRYRYEIHAPMPALVGRVAVEVGDEVKEGQGLVILEAMKMENELKAHQPGKVKHIYVQKGKPVEKGELLMLLE